MILNEFMELVQIDSGSLEEREIADAVIAKLRNIGCDVWEDTEMIAHINGTAGNIYAVLEGSMPGAILFSAHLDRVPNGKGIKPIIEDGKVIAQGTILAADDISGVVAILDGLRKIKASSQPHPRIEVLFTVCEERFVTGSRYIDYGRLTAKEGYVLDSPGRIGRVINGAPAKARISFEVKGRNAHAGNAPEQGVNAVMAAAKALARIPEGRLDEESTANYSTFEASGPTNVVNAKAVVRGEARSRNNEKLKSYIENLQEICKEAAIETGAEFHIDIINDYQSFLVPLESKCIQRVGKVFEKMDISMCVEAGGGGMDANRLNEHGITCVGLATGYSKNHTSSETLVIEDLLRAGEMVEKLICEYAQEQN